MANYRSMLARPTFTFIVGEENKAVHIHRDFVSKLSKPLQALMDNGSMTESTNGVARLADIDYNTFLYFAEYCYTQNYRFTPRPFTFTQSNGIEKQKSSNGVVRATPTPSASSISLGLFAPPAQTSIFASQALPPTETHATYTFARVGTNTTAPILPTTTNRATITFGTVRPHSPPQASAGPSPTVNALASKAVLMFQQRKLDVRGMTHEEYQEFLCHLRPADETSDDLTAHAKLWVFADRYLIDELKAVCLHKLHRDLSSFVITRDTIGHFTKLLAYTYDNTSENAKEHLTNIDCELRELVISYAAAKAEVLMKFQDFKNLLYGGGTLSVDFSSATTERLL